MSFQSSNSANNRRSYYRLQDKVYIELRLLDAEKVQLLVNQHRQLPQKKDEDTMYLDQLGRQLENILATVRSESPAAAQALEVMNRKVDFLAGMLFFERFRNAPADAKTVKTSTVDISEGGLSFNSKAPYKDGTHVELKIVVVGARVGIETVAQVVNSQKLERKGVEYFRIGLEFPFIAESDRRVLSRYIMDRQREQIRNVED